MPLLHLALDLCRNISDRESVGSFSPSVDFRFYSVLNSKMEPMDIVGKSKEDASLPKDSSLVYQILGFGEYIEEVYAAYEQHKIETTQDSLKGGKSSNGAVMTEEEAVAEQQRMFAEARARMNGGSTAPKQPETDVESQSNTEIAFMKDSGMLLTCGTQLVSEVSIVGEFETEKWRGHRNEVSVASW
ncbi:hypothetical protein GH714_028287 [Hevea brasiliensis]|uniref:Uncharacterized protein n=1 Tax=Hevea brasiliensis TaxID=3981 RepID=A0A6A6LE34_HEVBR|nr:hypothetical protein GH714_028287 [Hevea brasiliensis]